MDYITISILSESGLRVLVGRRQEVWIEASASKNKDKAPSISPELPTAQFTLRLSQILNPQP